MLARGIKIKAKETTGKVAPKVAERKRVRPTSKHNPAKKMRLSVKSKHVTFNKEPEAVNSTPSISKVGQKTTSNSIKQPPLKSTTTSMPSGAAAPKSPNMPSIKRRTTMKPERPHDKPASSVAALLAPAKAPKVTGTGTDNAPILDMQEIEEGMDLVERRLRQFVRETKQSEAQYVGSGVVGIASEPPELFPPTNIEGGKELEFEKSIDTIMKNDDQMIENQVLKKGMGYNHVLDLQNLSTLPGGIPGGMGMGIGSRLYYKGGVLSSGRGQRTKWRKQTLGLDKPKPKTTKLKPTESEQSNVPVNQEAASSENTTTVTTTDTTPASVVPPLKEEPPEEKSARLAAAPKLTVVNGNIVIDRSSLIVQSQQYQDPEYLVKSGKDKYDTVFESRLHVGGGGTQPRASSERWSQEHTDLFYQALAICGTDFTLMSGIFKNRTRKQLKCKFKREERENARRVDEALSNRKTLDKGVFEELATLASKSVEVEETEPHVETVPERTNLEKIKEEDYAKIEAETNMYDDIDE